MSLRTRAALSGVLVLLLLAGPAVGAVAPSATDDRAPATLLDAPAGSPPDGGLQLRAPPLAPAEETLRITLQPGGNARWTIRSNYSLGTPASERAFRDLAREYTSGAVRTRRIGAFRRASLLASNATGRPMSIRNVRRTYNVTNGTGQLVLQFTWTNFSSASGKRLRVDDVFNTSGRTWLPGLEPYQRLVIEPPPGYSIVRATPAGYTVSDDTVRWEGPRQFEPGNLSATYRRTAQPDRGFPVTLVGLVIGGLGIVAIVVYVLSKREIQLPSTPDTTDDDGDTAVTDGASAETATAANTGTSAGAGASSTEGDDIDAELLSDEERVERLLERNGGRMKQATIVKETDWSNAKVSQLLSAMEEDGRIDKLRIGRENLISFPDEDVTDLDEE